MTDQISNIFAEDATCEKMGESKSSLISLKETSQKPWPPAGVKWYYSDDYTAIAHGDCRDILPTLEPVDLVLTDPPYNVGMAFGDKTDDSRSDYEQWCEGWFSMLNTTASLITPGIANLAMWMKHSPRWILAWSKANSMKRVTVGFNCWEPILLFGKPPCNSYRDLFMAPIAAQKEAVGHPTPKPLLLFKQLIVGFSNGGDTVLDIFLGSGTTTLAAKQLGRKAIGIEIEEKYCEIAVKRLAQGVLSFGP